MQKYKAQKVELENGMRFDSKKEYKRFLELKVDEKEGLISDLKCQIPFELIPKQKLDNPRITKGRAHYCEPAVKYYADFVYRDMSGNLVVEDTKGVRTPEYIIKRKLMKQVHNIEIREI